MKSKKIYSRWKAIPRGRAGSQIQKGCLVIEGGAFRGLYNQGVLDAFMCNDINIQTVVGVSAGALAGINYVSGQIGRSARINLRYRHDSRYIGRKAIRSSHSLLNIDFLLKTCEGIEPFDMKRFSDKERKFVSVVSDCKSGQARYFSLDNCSDILAAVKASASMPYISPMVKVDGIPCLDGGCCCKIAYQWALEEGFDKIIVIKTRERGFRKPEKEDHLAEKIYRRYPRFAAALKNSNKDYNRQCEELDELEKEGRVLVIAPSKPVTVSRLEKDMEKLGDLYWLGYQDAIRQLEQIRQYLEP